MSFGFRKSFGSGPFRFTASKSGVSSSFGVRGARITTGPRGTYISVSAYGLHYRERIGHIGASGRRTTGANFTTDSAEDTIRTAHTTDLVDSSSEKLLTDLNNRAQMVNPAIFAWVVSALLLACSAGASTPVPLILLGLLTGAEAIVLHRWHRDRVLTRLTYELDPQAEVRFETIVNGVEALQRCQKLWRIERRQYTSDWKRNAGASSLNSRRCVGANRSTPPKVECNLQVPTINFGDGSLYLFPDRILVLQNGHFGAVSYEHFQVESATTRFIEEESVTGDTEVVGQRWRYMNKDGGPDRRFNNNRHIPVVLYGELTLRSGTGLNLVFQTSRPSAAKEFQHHIEIFKQGKTGSQSSRRKESKSDARQGTQSQWGAALAGADEAINDASKLFGLAFGASGQEISLAYHKLAAMYHPDKVAHLAPEFRVLAEQRMKEINAAYALLRSRQTA